jgi:endonuclease/exonuclease/phosphatase family metal-dependent hydrolase
MLKLLTFNCNKSNYNRFVDDITIKIEKQTRTNIKDFDLICFQEINKNQYKKFREKHLCIFPQWNEETSQNLEKSKFSGYKNSNVILSKHKINNLCFHEPKNSRSRYIRGEIKINDKKYYTYCVHFPSSKKAKERRELFELIINEIGEERAIIMGDF